MFFVVNSLFFVPFLFFWWNTNIILLSAARPSSIAHTTEEDSLTLSVSPPASLSLFIRSCLQWTAKLDKSWAVIKWLWFVSLPSNEPLSPYSPCPVLHSLHSTTTSSWYALSTSRHYGYGLVTVPSSSYQFLRESAAPVDEATDYYLPSALPMPSASGFYSYPYYERLTRSCDLGARIRIKAYLEKAKEQKMRKRVEAA